MIDLRRKSGLLKVLVPNLRTLRASVAGKPPRLRPGDQPPAARARRREVWRRLLKRRVKAVRLVEEIGAADAAVAAAVRKLPADFQPHGRRPPAVVASPAATSDNLARAAELRKELCHLMRITLESPPRCVAGWRGSRPDRGSTTPPSGSLSAGNLRLVVSIAKRYRNRGTELPGPDPGGQHRPDAGGGQVRARPRLQVLDLRHLVDSPGDHPRHRRPQPHHPHADPHDRHHEQRVGRRPRLSCRTNGREPTLEEDGRGGRPVAGRHPLRLRMTHQPLSLDQPVGDHDDTYFGEFLQDHREDDPLPEMGQGLLKTRIAEVLGGLKYREREILRLRYGLADGYAYTLEEVGKIFSVTRERVRQIETKAVRKLQHPNRARQLASFLDSRGWPPRCWLRRPWKDAARAERL